MDSNSSNSNSTTTKVSIDVINDNSVSSFNRKRLSDRVNGTVNNDLVDLTNSESDDDKLYQVFTKKGDAGIGKEVKDVRVELSRVFGFWYS